MLQKMDMKALLHLISNFFSLDHCFNRMESTSQQIVGAEVPYVNVVELRLESQIFKFGRI